jgi:hypothetical protein
MKLRVNACLRVHAACFDCMQVESITKSFHNQVQMESQASSLTSERCELLNKECERYLNRAYAAEKAAKDATAQLEPLNERIRVLEMEKLHLESETTRKEGVKRL